MVSWHDFISSLQKFLRFVQPKNLDMAKRLVKGEKKLFGVCSGLANYFDMDPTVMRMLGTGGLLYVILAIAMPEK
jgi:phage shock protein C